MKEYKMNIARAIIDEFNAETTINFPPVGETDRAVKFSDVAQKYGYTHINSSDIEDILKQVAKMDPKLHAVRFVRDPSKANASESRWSTTYITDLEF